MALGTIKKLVHDKGFGFIATGDGSDVFFHHSTVADRQFAQHPANDAVEIASRRDVRQELGVLAADGWPVGTSYDNAV